MANFLLATTGILNLRCSVRNGKFSKDVSVSSRSEDSNIPVLLLKLYIVDM